MTLTGLLSLPAFFEAWSLPRNPKPNHTRGCHTGPDDDDDDDDEDDDGKSDAIGGA
ncbi:hypothetical protein MY4824_005986 [Beauveria thailandica]